MEKVILHCKNIIAELINYLLFVMIEIILFQAITKQIPPIFHLMLLFLLPLFFYLVRCTIHKFWMFGLLHILPLLLLVSVTAGTLVTAIIYTAAAILQVIHSLSTRIALLTKPEQRDYGNDAVIPVVTLGLGMVLYFINNRPEITKTVICSIILYLIYYYLKHFLHYMDMSRRTTGTIPMKDIFRIDLVLVGGFAAITLFLLEISAGQGIWSYWGRKIWDVLRRIIIFIFSRFDFSRELPPLPEAEVSRVSDESLYGETAGGGLLSRILEIFFNLVGAVILLVFIAAIIYGTVKLIRRVFARRAGELPAAAQEGEGDSVEKLSRSETRKAGLNSALLFKTPEEKIRKTFRTLLWQCYKKEPRPDWAKLLQFGTARECLIGIVGEREEAWALLALYEKARYTGHKCSTADSRQAKRLAGNLLRAYGGRSS